LPREAVALGGAPRPVPTPHVAPPPPGVARAVRVDKDLRTKTPARRARGAAGESRARAGALPRRCGRGKQHLTQGSVKCCFQSPYPPKGETWAREDVGAGLLRRSQRLDTPGIDASHGICTKGRICSWVCIAWICSRICIEVSHGARRGCTPSPSCTPKRNSPWYSAPDANRLPGGVGRGLCAPRGVGAGPPLS